MPFTRSATMTGSIAGNPLEAGNNHFFVSDQVYFRRPDGTWSPDLTLTIPNGYTINDISLRPLNPICFTYEVWTRTSGSVSFNHDNTRIHFIKNGGQTNFYTTLRGELPKDLQNPYTVIAFANDNYKNSTGIALNRIVTDGVVGYQLDYPVTRITTHDGVQPHYTSFDYHAATATIDPSGNVAQYHEVTTIEGSQQATSRPNGYTKTLFFNGSPVSEAGIGSAGATFQLMGTPYETRTFDKYGKMVASGKTWFSTFTRDIRDGNGTKIEVGYYVRPAKQKSMVDGIETITEQSYDSRTGLLTQSASYDYDSKRGNGVNATNTTTTSYKYFWEHYDPNRESNLLSPVIQTKQTIRANNTTTIVGVSATTWRSWNNVFAPHKTYQWKRTGTSDFNFTTWSEAGEPTTDWIKVSQIDAVDTQGNVLQTSTR
jgi:hypothetical protein